MNIAAMQSLMGVGSQSPISAIQKNDTAMQSFGHVFAGISMNAVPAEKMAIEETVQIPFEMIQQLFDAKTPEELEQALQQIPGYENVEFSKEMYTISGKVNLTDLATMLSIDPERLLESLKSVLEKTGLVEDEIDELNSLTDVWSLLTVIEDRGMNFYQQLFDSMEGFSSQNQSINLLALLKATELIAPKVDMTLSMEQKMFSFQSMLQSASEQIQQLTLTATNGKQNLLPFMQQQQNLRVVVQADTSSSNADENSTQKQPETMSHQSSSSNTAITQTRVEFSIPQSESTGSSRSEALMREMQTLFKRSNFGQVGGSTRMLIKLYPEHLGQIRIELHETNGVLSARILASTALAKGMLDSQMHQLRNALAQQNLQIERIDVTQSIQESSKNDREQAFNEQFKREQEEQSNKKKSQTEDEMTFEEFMIEVEV